MIKKAIIILSLLSFLISPCYAQQQQSYYKQKFLGVCPKLNPKLLPDDQAINALNITLDESGAFKDRDTFGQYNTSSGALGSNFITGLFKFYSTTSKYFVACAGTKIASGSGGTWTDITNAGISITSGYYWTAVTFANKIYLFNLMVAMQVWTGTGATTTPAGVPATNCSYGAVHKARGWAAKSSTNPYRLYFSSLNNMEDWTTTGGYVDLPDTTQMITGLLSWGGYLYIFTETNIFTLIGDNPYNFSLVKSNSQVGAIAPRTIKVTDKGIAFLARSGLYTFNGNSSIKLSDKVEPIINSISKTLIQNACGIYDAQNKYWLSYPDATHSYNNKILIYDMTLEEWYEFDNVNISYFEKASGGTDRGELYGGSSTNNGIVYTLQSATGTESVTHSTYTDFNNNATFNTVVTQVPSVEALSGYDKYTKLVAHFNGATGDEPTPAFTGQTLTYNGASQVSTVQKKFGTASLLLALASSDYVSLASSADWDWGTGAWTVDCWVYPTSIAGAGNGVGIAANQYYSLGVNGNWAILILPTGAVSLDTYDGQANQEYVNSAAGEIVVNNWYHIAVVGNGAGNVKIYKNGSQIASGAITKSLGDTAPTIAIGYSTYAPVLQFYDGYIDEFRVSKGVARWTSTFTPYTIEYDKFQGGVMTSPPIQINAAGSVSLDKISWVEDLPTNTKIAFQTRTGTTNDTVDFVNWQAWTSTNSVVVNNVTNGTTVFTSSSPSNFTVQVPSSAQPRNVLYFEDEDSVSPNCIAFQTYGVVSKDKYAEEDIASKNLSTYDWLTGWYKTPCSGNTVELSIGEDFATENTTTFNTCTINSWEKWHWYIGGITSASRDNIHKVRITYKGDAAGYVYYGGITAHNFYSSSDTMSSTPNDWIQYRSILGSNYTYSPELYSLTLTYTPPSGTSESSLSSYYQTKWIDFGTPQIDKQYTDFLVDVYTEDSNEPFYFDYDIDNGKKTGTINIASSNTVTDTTVNIHKYFPSSTFGKSISFKYRNDNAVDSKHTVRGFEVRFRSENLQ